MCMLAHCKMYCIINTWTSVHVNASSIATTLQLAITGEQCMCNSIRDITFCRRLNKPRIIIWMLFNTFTFQFLSRRTPLKFRFFCVPVFQFHPYATLRKWYHGKSSITWIWVCQLFNFACFWNRLFWVYDETLRQTVSPLSVNFSMYTKTISWIRSDWHVCFSKIFVEVRIFHQKIREQLP